MVVVVSVVAMFDVVVVLGAVCGIVVPENQRVIFVAVKGCRKLIKMIYMILCAMNQMWQLPHDMYPEESP